MVSPMSAEAASSAKRPGFAPVVLVGIASAALCAAAGNQPWATGTGDRATGFATLSATEESGQVPAATAAALVVLACWGVLLVTRGRVRRVVAGLGALAAMGVVAAVVVGFWSAPDSVREAYAQLGIDDPEVSRTGWYWLVTAVSPLSMVATVLAVRLVPSWPEMGSRYDAPAVGVDPSGAASAEEKSPLDLWKAMDEGRDPTA